MSTNVSVLTALIEARRLLNNGWIQKTFARDANGHMCPWDSQKAKSFCSIGAIYRALDWRNTYNSNLVMDVFESVAEHADLDSRELSALVRYNDSHTKDEVLVAFDRAIAAKMKLDAVVESKELELA